MATRTWCRAIGPWTAALALLASSAGALGCDADCDQYLNEPVGEGVTLRVRNERLDPIFLGMEVGCVSTLVPFDVRPAGGTDLSLLQVGCGTCEKFQTQSTMCEAICAMAPVFAVAPGGSYEIGWDARHYISEQMPESCYAEESMPRCSRLVAIEPGAYELSAYAFTGCTASLPGGTCACQPSSDGSCRVEGGADLEGERLTTAVSFQYPLSGQSPPATALDIVFGL